MSYIAGIKGSELKDVLLFSAFLIVQNLKNEEEIAKVEKAFWILLIVLLITGFFYIFSPIRLSRLVSDLFKPSPNWKFAHHYGNLLGIGIHLPIGLMNTHLTFGGTEMNTTVFFLFFVVFFPRGVHLPR